MTTKSVPFTDIPRVGEQPAQEPQYLESVRTLQVGFGSKVLRADQRGIWLGGEDPTTAAFSVDMDGNMIANSVTLTGYIAVGDALSDIGSGNITSTYIGSNAITSSKISANAVTADKISVSDLSAIDADLGTITAGDIRGARIRTSTTGDRVEISDSDDSIKIYDAGDLRLEIYEDRITFFEDDGTSDVVSLYASPTGNFLIAGTSSNDLLFSSARDLTLSATDDIFILADDTINLNTGSLADDIFIGLGSNTFMQFGNARVYMDVYFDMQGNDITDGGDFTCVSLTETSDIRRKQNVKPLEYGLNEVMQLDPISYQFKKQVPKRGLIDEKRIEEKTKVTHLGFSAQDVYKIMPELTKHAEEGSEEAARLYSTQMIPVLVQAIQDLKKELDTVQKSR